MPRTFSARKFCALRRKNWSWNLPLTPHSTTKLPPADVMFNINQKSNDEILKKNHETAQQRNQQYHDQINHATDSQLTTGDTVLVKQPKYFKPEPYIVTDTKGTMITAQSCYWQTHYSKHISLQSGSRDQAHFLIIIREEEEGEEQGGGEFEQQPQPEN